MSNVDFTEFAPHSVNSAEVTSRGYAMAPAGVKDDGKIVAFYYHAQINRMKSANNGAPIYDNVIYVSVQNPGEKDCIKREAREEDKQRWPGQWHAFQQGRKFVADGTPLEQLFPDRADIVAAINAFNIQTVQQLANLSGDAISRGGIGFGNWVEAAKKYLQSAAQGVDFHKFDAERRKWAEREAALQKQINDLGSQVRQLIQRVPGGGSGGYPPTHAAHATFDAQSHITGNSMAERFPAPQTIPAPIIPEAPDLGSIATGTFNAAEPEKPRRGRPAGSKNKPKETN